MLKSFAIFGIAWCFFATPIASKSIIAAMMNSTRHESAPSATVESTYAKVAKWGAKPSASIPVLVSEGRSNSGQTLFSQRSDVNVVNGQNIKSKPEITYSYSMLKNPVSVSRVGEAKSEKLPATGEVVQERYNPKPYFDYQPIPPKSSSNGNPGDSNNNKPSVVYGAPFDSFPAFPQSQSGPAPPKTVVDIKPSVSIYNSPYDSYSPPAASNPAGDLGKPPTGPAYPPNDRPPQSSYGPPASGDSSGLYDAPSYGPPSIPNSYLPAKKPSPPSPPPPPPPASMDYTGPYAPPEKHPKHADIGPPVSQTVSPPSAPQQPYFDHPPKDYYDHHDHDHDHGSAPSGPSDDHQHHHHHDHDDSAPSGPAEDHSHHYHGPPSAMPTAPQDDGGAGDLSPPVQPPGGGSLGFAPKLPDYLDHAPSGHGFHDSYHGNAYHFDHDHDHHDHHIYHEVVTTTTEAPEDERVNKGHYSYYYLGRKLWYVPLYFSVYFIIYITVLILKSIARHKVNLVHDYDKVKGRSFDQLDELTTKVTRAINNNTQTYM